MHELIDTLMMRELGNTVLREKKDSAVFKWGNKTTAFTADSYVVKPLFFPGGDIGSLAVYGTVNDLSVCGARPVFISLSLMMEEGLDRVILAKIIKSIKAASKRAGVCVVTGDTKVVEKGSCDQIFINTSGIGEVYYGGLSVGNIMEGDRVIVSGPVGDHAISVLSRREGIEFKTKVQTDSAPLNDLISKVLKASKKVRFMRDPTRGGLAATLNEIVSAAAFGISIDEGALPIRDGVRQACELLGFDPLYLACEGRAVFIAAKKDEVRLLGIMRRHKDGRAAKTIGEISGDHKGRVYLNTSSGGRRIVEMPAGEQLPRIC